MKVLITGSKGFVGKNLVLALKQIQNGNNKSKSNVVIEEIYEYDIDNDLSDLSRFCKDCDIVFNLSGVNRPIDGNFKPNYEFVGLLCEELLKNNNKAPIMLSSSIQASLEGKYSDSEYGKSKLMAEKMLIRYGKENNIKVYLYRLPNLFGKWCKPNYNSAITTFCYNYAHDLPIQVNDDSIELELLYIDDLITELLSLLENKEHNDDNYYRSIKPVYKVTLGEIVKCLDRFKTNDNNIGIANTLEGTFENKLYSTYISYLPKEKAIIDLRMNCDLRGSFTELLHTEGCGQVSVNISKPGITKGNHFHNRKWEYFIVVKGKALIQERNILTNELYEFEVSGEKIQAVYMIPGFTHNIINLSKEEELITIMWANEKFDINSPDTYYEEV